MTDRWTDQHLEAVLASVGAHLDLDVVVEPAPVFAARAAKTGAGWLRVAAAVVLIALAAGLTIAPVRQAVADWLGIGSTGIERVPDLPDPTGLPSLEDGLEAANPAEIEAELGRSLPDVSRSTLGPPDLVGLAPEGGVIVAWDEASTTLWITLQDQPVAERRQKLATMDARIEPVADLGEAALVLEGGHVLKTPDRRLASDNVVIWLRDGFEYRLESDLDPQNMTRIARSMDERNR